MTAPILLVGTPIGNLGDVSHRAVEALRSATVVACEDTRRTGALLRHLGVDRPRFVVLNDHTERDVVDRLVALAVDDERVVVVSDAGMPAISDPGHVLVRAAVAADVPVEVVPGPSALLAALVLSGLATDRFVFDGFLPRKGAERSTRLDDLCRQRRTTVLYEAPHRLERTLVDLERVCGGDRPVAVARELTKLYEEVWRGPLEDAVDWARDTSPRGEIVIVVAGAPETEVDDEAIAAALSEALAGGATVRDASDEVAKRLGVKRRLAYELALALRE